METLKTPLWDTRWDTKKVFVPLTNSFSLRNYKDRDNKSLVYLTVRDGKTKIRINTEIRIPPSWWNNKTKRISPADSQHSEIAASLNLILENIEAKITTIKTQYFLSKRILDARTLIEEFQTATPEFDFIAFMRHYSQEQIVKPRTMKGYKTVISKLENLQPEIPFHKINEQFLSRYRKKYSQDAEITYNTDLKVIKKFLRIAKKKGITFPLDLDDLKINVNSKRIIYLMPEEVQRLQNYFYSEFLQESHILPLGYFLFSCYTGMRISDIQQLTRQQVEDHTFSFTHVKTGNFQTVKLNASAIRLIEHQEILFKTKIVDQKINSHLKNIAKICKITKNVSMHVGRHTFATTFYRNSKDIFALKKLLGHSKIEHTMIYVHVLQGEELEGYDAVQY